MKILALMLVSAAISPLVFAGEQNLDEIQKWGTVAMDTLAKNKPDVAEKVMSMQVFLSPKGAKVTFTTSGKGEVVSYTCHAMGGMDMCM